VADVTHEAYVNISRLAVEDPKAARAAIEDLLRRDEGAAIQILRSASSAGQGRVRQLVANVYIQRSEHAPALTALLRDWLSTETDELARRALNTAMTVGTSAQTRPRRHSDRSEGIVVAYRYANDRLMHRVRNALAEPQTKMLQLRSLIGAVLDTTLKAPLEAKLAELSDALNAVGRLVEFDVSDQVFEHRPVNLLLWIRGFDRKYAQTYKQLLAGISSDGEPQIVASDQLLELIFWNIWVNAQQMLGDRCEITVRLQTNRSGVIVIVSDNGPGYGTTDLSSLSPTTARLHRGRGMVEIQDAVERLRGKVALREINGAIRLQLSFPTVNER
jgi:signal transduction histidine kinase